MSIKQDWAAAYTDNMQVATPISLANECILSGKAELTQHREVPEAKYAFFLTLVPELNRAVGDID